MDFLENIEMPAWLSYGIAITVVILFVWWKFKNQLLFPIQSIETSGVITNWMGMNEGGKKYFYPLIEFTTQSGELVKFRAEERSEGAPLYEPGTKVSIRYHRKDVKFVKVKYPAI
ncbi:MAG: DUF3592 domain-containing protein [Flavobacteriales bacterium]|jgi:hypothetical protein